MSDRQSLDEVVTLLEARRVPGLSLAYITGPGTVPVTRTWGIASVRDSRPVTPETIFRAGSLSKPVTAWPGPLQVRHLTWDGIAAAIRMNNHHLTALGTYRLPGGQTVTLTASEPDRWGQRRIEITLPGQPRVELAEPFTDGHWRVPGLEALVVFEPPDGLVFHQNGRSVQAKRIT